MKQKKTFLNNFEYRQTFFNLKKALGLILALVYINVAAIGENFDASSIYQEKSVSGTVVDVNEVPLPGATIVVKGTSIGTVTNFDGSYNITVPDGSEILVISYVGFETQEINISNRSEIKIVLVEDASLLDEVVVVGYGSQKKINLTGAVSTVSSKEITQAPVVSTSQALVGRVPGLVSTQESGEPGQDDANLSIRGFGTPLIIIDGFEAPLNNIDPSEIESISILKDASAAIYGSRAGNGVVLIKTKRGRISKPTFSANSSYALQSLTIFPKPLNAAKYAEIIREAEINSGVPESNQIFSEEDVRLYQEGTQPGYEGTDWWDTVMNDTSPLVKHNISMSGGSEDIKYYTFLGYTGQTGMFKSGDNKFNRYNLRSNIDGNINDNLTVSLDISLVLSDLTSPTRNTSTLFSDFLGMRPTFPASLPDPDRVAYAGTIVSPVASTNRDIGGYRDRNDNQIFSNFGIKYDVPNVEGLSFKGVFNYIYSTTENKNWNKSYDLYTYDYTSEEYTTFSGAIATSLSERFSKSRTLSGQMFVNYDRTFAEDHDLSLLFLTEFSDYKDKWFSAGRGNYISNSLDYLFAGGEDSQSSNGAASETSRLGYIGRLNYAYKGKYLLESTIRYDGSPKFAEDKRWGLFPSLSLGWRISEESFFKDKVDWINNLKLRGGFSKTGFDGIGAFQYLTGFNFGDRYIVDGQVRNGLSPTGLANPNITWEEMTIYNLGLEYNLWNSKLYGEIDVFYRDRDKILTTRAQSVPSTFGATLPEENINRQSNRGFEFLIGTKNTIGDFSYDISGNLSWTRAKWEKFDEPEYTDEDDIRVNQRTGNWVNRWFGYETDGLFTTQDEIDNHQLDQDEQGNATIMTGDIKYIDQNNDNVLDWRDRVDIGRGHIPEIMFGTNINLSYKNFDFSAVFQGAANFNARVNMHIANESNVPDIIYDLRWTEENNDKWAKVPRLYMGNKVNNNHISDYWLRDASYLRLKVLNIGYNFPKDLMDRISFNSIRLFVSGTNLFTISALTEYSMDPESPSGWDPDRPNAAPSGTRTGYYYPQQKVYSFGINMSF
ncbi:SusC/RagA family TonB-linked outer membrane protein [Neotamlana sedimentorum]|uniref:SusC/RagA family TonB-linked outer membrane protein n=1 Tax=Neotamlana sedimentorum TaxID=1435349 RepID=UPI00069A8A1C|nr:TonB-dependent receptor [Tamlana sedimentorum]